MDDTNLKAILEGLIFASEEPLSLATLTALVEDQGLDRAAVKTAIENLIIQYQESADKGLMLREINGSYQFVTKPALAGWIQKLNASKPKSLSQAALETLAIIAYRQPLVRSEVEAIRGVDSGGVLKTLLERGIIKILGRKEEAGQPLIYGTTPAFLELFHLKNLEELPSMREIEESVSAGQPQTVEGSAEEDSFPQEACLVVSEEEKVQEEEALLELETSLKKLRQVDQIDVEVAQASPTEQSDISHTDRPKS